MNPFPIVTSVISKINLPKEKLEDVVNKIRLNPSRSFVDDSLVPGYENILWRFAQTSVSGEVEIVFANNLNNKILCVDVPARAGFLAGCTKAGNGNYELVLASSLS